MGKFILTNSVAKTSESISFSTANGYVVSGKYENEKISFASYYKLAIKNENFLSIGDDFVSVTGTVIYKDTIGQESLRMIYNDFTGDINVIRDNVLGNGAFIIKKGVEITVFTEYLAMYHVFYTENNMYSMFFDSSSFNKDLSNWDVYNVKDYRYVFDYSTFEIMVVVSMFGDHYIFS